MSNDYIRKQDAVEAIGEEYAPRTDFERGMVSQMSCDKAKIKALPPADVAPVVHGRWLPIVSYNNTYKCSECGRLLVDITDGLKMVAKHYPYCHCGAKMDGG